MCFNQNLEDATLPSGLHTLALWPSKGALGEGTELSYSARTLADRVVKEKEKFFMPPVTKVGHQVCSW